MINFPFLLLTSGSTLSFYDVMPEFMNHSEAPDLT